MRIISATQNKHKLEEIYAIIKNYNMELVTLETAGYEPVEIEENGKTCDCSWKNSNWPGRSFRQYR